MAAPPAPPLILASTSPRRREILEQLGIPFRVVPPLYEEADDDPVAHAVGKARSVAPAAGDKPVLGCDAVRVDQAQELGPALCTALKSTTPHLVDVIVK